MNRFTSSIASELAVNPSQVAAAIDLLDEGASVPFISRYRKEATGGLSDTQLRQLEERLFYLREMDERRQTILSSIKSQEKLTPELEKQINEAATKVELEDLYLPYKPKRRTKAQIAIEAGLEPLANAIFENPTLNPEQEAQQYLNAQFEINDTKAALDGARQILMERFSEDAALLATLREQLWKTGVLHSQIAKGKEQEAVNFSDYFDYREPIQKIPSHRALALFRGRNENFLQVKLTTENDDDASAQWYELAIAHRFEMRFESRAADSWLRETVRYAWRIKIFTHLEIELMTQLRESAQEEAIKVFASNLRDLLLAAPAGAHVTMGLDPGIRTGTKVVVIDETGKLLTHTTIYPLPPKNQWQESLVVLAKLCQQYQVTLISIGNGTASRETDRLVLELLKLLKGQKIEKIITNEAGASVYSASELAAAEFPDLDVTLRGAVSIARRIQDPLAELVKIEPKSIGVGQYQHDVNQVKLARMLTSVVEDCVNAVGVDVNTASVPLLTRVSGLNETMAKNIVAYRDQHGAFKNREELRKVTRIGEKTYQQAAGFLRIMKGENPLDASSVHPESYPLVNKILQSHGKLIRDVIGDSKFLQSLHARDYVDADYGLPTVTDVLKELEKPGRDPRPEFKTANFRDGIEDVKDLKVGMSLEGVVTNVTNFGAFVDIGVHQDGLVHISELANRFVSDPRDVVKAGQIVKVRVLEVDVQRKRIALSMRDDNAGKTNTPAKPSTQNAKQPAAKQSTEKPHQSGFGEALANAWRK